MRSAVFLAFGLAGLLAVGDAGAQGRVDRRALDELSGTPATPAPAAKEQPQRQRGTAQQRPAPPPAAAAPPASAPAPSMPDAPDPPPVLAPAMPRAIVAPVTEIQSTPAPLLPIAPPAPPVIPPPLAVPMRPVPPPPVVEVAADAPGVANRTDEGWRITFGPGRAALNPAKWCKALT